MSIRKPRHLIPVGMEKDISTIYKPLDPLSRQFRLLRLVDSAPDCPQCELKMFSLSDGEIPPWKALSYRWGEDIPELNVKLDGRVVLVRRSLHTFLRQMSIEKRWNWFFVDALCINQINKAEKTHQVSLMSTIFRNAEEVMAWIMHEPANNGGEEGKQQIASLARAELEDIVLENSYWTRLWIVQEVLLAKRLTIRIGELEVEWSNLVPEGNPLQRRGLPTKNKNISMGAMQPDAEPYSTKLTATNILSYRHFETKSLRAGNRLPFHRAFDFFSLQLCSDLHDKVFGYIGLTNSRMRVDYAMPTLDLFVATLADYFLSVGLITEDLTPYRKRMQFIRTSMTITSGNNLIVPFLAFNFDPFDPLVYLVFNEVAKFFSPGYQEGLMVTALTTWWCLKRSSYQQGIEELANADHKFELKYIGSVCVKFIKLMANEHSEYTKLHKTTVEQHKRLSAKDDILITSASCESRKYSAWAAHVRSISEQMWQRFQQSGEDDEGELDDESWALIA